MRKVILFAAIALLFAGMASAADWRNNAGESGLEAARAGKTVSIRGYNSDTDAMSSADAIWSGSSGDTNTVTTIAPQAVVLVSENASDTSTLGGARTVTISAIDNDYAVVTETVVMSGTTQVSTISGDMIYVNSMSVATAGSTGYNVGDIDARADSGHTCVNSIVATRNSSECASYLVPAGKTLYLLGMTGGAGTTEGTLEVQAKDLVNGTTWAPVVVVPYSKTSATTANLEGITVPEKHLVRVVINNATADSVKSAVAVTAAID